MSGRLRVCGHEVEVDARRSGRSLTLDRDDGPTREWEVRRVGLAEFVIREPDDASIVHTVHAIRDGEGFWIHLDGRTWFLEPIQERAGAAPTGGLAAPIPATVSEVLVREGDAVEAGQVLIVLSAMKMQIEIKAPWAGIVRKLEAAAGDSVDGGRALLTVEPRDVDDAPAVA